MTPTASASDLLAAIVAATRRIVEMRKRGTSAADLRRRASLATPRPDRFRKAVAHTDRLNVIAECKRRSPSRGILNQNYDPAEIAKGYENAGAAAISVLTEPTFFDGALEHLSAVRRTTQLPILRKDFIVDPYQLFEARAAGADAILLIVAALSPAELTRLHAHAVDTNLDVLVEVHHAEEVQIALDAGATMIGVNNRNLRTLAVDLAATSDLIEQIPENVVAVAESGLKTKADLERLRGLGYQAFLIGERFMIQADPGAALHELIAGTHSGVAEECS